MPESGKKWLFPSAGASWGRSSATKSLCFAHLLPVSDSCPISSLSVPRNPLPSHPTAAHQQRDPSTEPQSHRAQSSACFAPAWVYLHCAGTGGFGLEDSQHCWQSTAWPQREPPHPHGCPSGCQPAAGWALRGWTPPAAPQPIRPWCWHPFEIDPAGLSHQLFL